MSRKLDRTAAIAVATTMMFTVSGALAQDPVQTMDTSAQAVVPPSAEAETAESDASAVRFVSQEVVQPLPVEDTSFLVETDEPSASTLKALVASIDLPDELSSDMRCLAGAIYFEARGEPLLGQLAVGRVIVNRAASDDFPSSYCGVVYQPSQFSFVRGGRMPKIRTSSAAWHNARAIAKIAHEGLWESPAKGALFFHATSVKPGWRLTRVARVSSHIFYR